MIDWRRVDELREEIGPEDFEEVVTLFLGEAEESVIRVGRAANPSELAKELHFLRGAATNLGFQALSRHCESAERDAGLGRVSPAALATIASVFLSSRASFRAGPG